MNRTVLGALRLVLGYLGAISLWLGFTDSGPPAPWFMLSVGAVLLLFTLLGGALFGREAGAEQHPAEPAQAPQSAGSGEAAPSEQQPTVSPALDRIYGILGTVFFGIFFCCFLQPTALFPADVLGLLKTVVIVGLVFLALSIAGRLLFSGKREE